MSELNLSQVVLPTFHDFWIERRKEYYTHYVLKGGRNSGKTSSIGQAVAMDLKEKPISCLGIRKVENTIRLSLFEQMKTAVRQLGISHEFHFVKTPMQMIYKPRGNAMYFAGLDEPEKLKGIKHSEFPISLVWFEEITEFKTEDELQIVIDSIIRETLPQGIRYKFFYSYNPPRRKSHWLNKKYESVIKPPFTYIHSSDYRGNRFLSEQALEMINAAKLKNERYYNWNYLGMPTGGGVVPFENLNFRTITDQELKIFNNFRQGIDWGYGVDPFAFGRWHYNKSKRIIYALDEIYGLKLSNRYVADQLKLRRYNYDRIIADSEEPKSIDEMKELGIKIVGAIKGKGSIEYGVKWLDDLDEIVIDPARTPNTAQEFESIDFKVDKDGNQLAELEDTNNHSIDATRYAFENDSRTNRVRFPSQGRTSL